MLAARAGQLALHHGRVERVPTGVAGVSGVRRDHAGQTVLCVTSTVGVPVMARVPVRDATTETELIELAQEESDGPPQVLRPAADGVVTVELDATRTRWFRVRHTAHPPPDEPTDPFTPPAR